MIAGAIWAEAAWGRFWGWDPKETWAFIAWVVYAAYLHARTTAGWRGRPAAWVNVVGLVVMIFNLTVRQHGVDRAAQLRRRELTGHAASSVRARRCRAARSSDGCRTCVLPCPHDRAPHHGPPEVTVGKHAAPDGAAPHPLVSEALAQPHGFPRWGAQRGETGWGGRLRRPPEDGGLGWPADLPTAESQAGGTPAGRGCPPRLAPPLRARTTSPEVQAGEPSSRLVRRSSSRRNSGSSSGARGRVGRVGFSGRGPLADAARAGRLRASPGQPPPASPARRPRPRSRAQPGTPRFHPL